MASSGPWQHPTTGSPAGPQQKRGRGRPRGSGRPRKVVDPTTTPPALPQQKRPRGRPRKVVVSSTGASAAGGGSVGGDAVQGNTNREAAFGFSGGIGEAQGSVFSYSGMPTYGSQHVPASVGETRVGHGEQSQERYEQTIRPFGAVWPSNPITDSQYNSINLISQHFPDFPLYVEMLQNPGFSELPLIQQNLASLLPNASLQQPASNIAVSASALQHPNPAEPSSQVREIVGGMEDDNPGLSPLPVVQRQLPMSLTNPLLQQPNSSTLLSWLPERFQAVPSSALRHRISTEPSNQSYRNTSSGPTVSASALYRPIPIEPSNESYRNTSSSVSTVSASALQHPNSTDPSNESYRNRDPESF